MNISQDVLTQLSLMTTDANTAKFIGKLPRDLYLKTNKVLDALGGVWNRKAGAHVFPSSARELLDSVIITGEVETKQDLGFFPTPKKLAQTLVAIAGVQPEDFVLEPSAGDGAIVAELIAARAGVFAIERDKKRRAQLFARFPETTRISVLDWPSIAADDFLDFEPIEPFDRVVMNPPFCKVGKGDHLDHVQHAYSMLIPGGQLVSVLPAGVKFRQDRRHQMFRSWFVERGGTLVDLPDDAFAESGTRVRTVVLSMRGR